MLTQNLTTPLVTSLTDSLIEFDPRSISNLGAWYDAQDNNSINAGAFTWLDKSGNSRSAIATGSSTYPTLTSSAINSKQAFLFDGTTDYFAYDGTFLANTNYTIFVVEQRNIGTGASRYFLSGNQASPVANEVLMLGYKTGTLCSFSQFSNNLTMTVPSYSSPIPRSWTFRFSSVDGKDAYLNGTSQTLNVDVAANPTQGLISYNNAQIGRYLASNYYSGYIGEILIYNKKLTNLEMIQVQNYINNKWGF